MDYIKKISETINLVIRVIVWIICTVIWFFIGFTFWIPLLIRTIVNYTFSLVLAVFRPESNIDAAERGLEFAMEFYMHGFSRINQTMSEKKHYNGGYEAIQLGQFWAFFKELVYALSIWIIALLLTGVLEIHPERIIENIQNVVTDTFIEK